MSERTRGRVYDPHRGFGQRPLQAVPVLPRWKAIALYVYEVAVMLTVIGVFVWMIR